jgi:hypothetical protein
VLVLEESHQVLIDIRIRDVSAIEGLAGLTALLELANLLHKIPLIIRGIAFAFFFGLLQLAVSFLNSRGGGDSVLDDGIVGGSGCGGLKPIEYPAIREIGPGLFTELGGESFDLLLEVSFIGFTGYG